MINKKKQMMNKFDEAIKDETTAPAMYSNILSSMSNCGFNKSDKNKVKQIIADEKKHKKK